MKTISMALAGLSLVAAPTIAQAAPIANPAANLSVAKSVRANAPVAKGDKLAGGIGIVGAAIVAGIAAIGIIAIVNDNDDDDSDSN